MMRQSHIAKALVTGGTGFVGSHLVEHLLSRGFDVVCLVRDSSRLRWLSGQNVHIVQGDCSNPDSLVSAVRDVSIVFHAAGLTKAISAGDYYSVNHLGTLNLLRACERYGAKVKKFVYISSLAAAGPDRSGKETYPVSDYGWSKLRGEEEVLRFRDMFSVVILRPSAVYGPRDTDVFELFKWAAKGFFLDIRGERYLNWCYVEDLAEAIALAGEREIKSGSVYCVAENRVYSTSEFRTMLQRTGGISARTVEIPYSVAYTIGMIHEIVGFLRGKPTIMNRQKVREAAQRSWICDVTSIEKDLGFRSRFPLEDGLAITWKWYRDNGWIN